MEGRAKLVSENANKHPRRNMIYDIRRIVEEYLEIYDNILATPSGKKDFIY